MTANPAPPNLTEADQLLTQLLDEVKLWESPRAGGTQLGVNAERIAQLLDTRVSFGNPKDRFIPLTAATFAAAGITLDPIQSAQLEKDFNFYYLTITVDTIPRPGATFKSLTCRLDFGPKGETEPIVQAIFPVAKWHQVLAFGGELNLGLDGNLAWEAGLDLGDKAEALNLPADLAAHVANKNAMKSFVVMPNFKFNVGRFDINAVGAGNSTCYWRITNPDIKESATTQFGVVFKTPKTVTEITLDGLVWTEPDMDWLGANLRDVFRELSVRLKAIFQDKNQAGSQLARGAAEQWTLKLPE